MREICLSPQFKKNWEITGDLSTFIIIGSLSKKDAGSPAIKSVFLLAGLEHQKNSMPVFDQECKKAP